MEWFCGFGGAPLLRRGAPRFVCLSVSLSLSVCLSYPIHRSTIPGGLLVRGGSNGPGDHSSVPRVGSGGPPAGLIIIGQ